MKTVAQIENRVKALQKSYTKEVKNRGYRENMGNKYTNKLDNYIQDIYVYDYEERERINQLKMELNKTVY